MPKSYCENCGITHTSIMCFNKPRKPLLPHKSKIKQREIETKVAWFEANPGPIYECYLQISANCLYQLDRRTVVQEHVIPKSRGKKYKYSIANIRPACSFCNSVKGSRTIGSLIKDYPQLTWLLP